jgi:hypothetical protein
MESVQRSGKLRPWLYDRRMKKGELQGAVEDREEGTQFHSVMP